MASIAFEEYKNKLNNLRPALDDLGGALHLDEARNEVEKLEEESAQDGFWNDTENSQRVQKRIKTLKHKLERYAKLTGAWEDMLTMCEMAVEEDDDSMLPDLESEFQSFEETLESMRLETLLTGEYDANNAILTFHAGAGGTEAQDWTSMLYRMYNMWAERHGYTVKLMDYLDGDEAGIKSATIMIEGENAYGFLKSENGIHRLVRISPFDASGRRHTSFAAVEVMPEITEDSEIELRDEDIKMDVYRSSGAGGATSRTSKTARTCSVRVWPRSRSVSTSRRSPTSRASSSRSSGAVRSVRTCSCRTRWPRITAPALKTATFRPSWTATSTASSTPI